MNTWRSRVALLLLFWMMAKAFDVFAARLPDGEFWDTSYYCFAATTEYIMYYQCRRFVTGKLCRDLEALCIASILAHAFGIKLYMAYSPPSTYKWIIQGINYVLAIRVIFTGGGNVLRNYYSNYMVRRFTVGRAGGLEKEAQG